MKTCRHNVSLYETCVTCNYDNDLVLAEKLNITTDQLDAIPIEIVDQWRNEIKTEKGN